MNHREEELAMPCEMYVDFLQKKLRPIKTRSRERLVGKKILDVVELRKGILIIFDDNTSLHLSGLSIQVEDLSMNVSLCEFLEKGIITKAEYNKVIEEEKADRVKSQEECDRRRYLKLKAQFEPDQQ